MSDIVERLKYWSGQRTREECTLGATGMMIWDAIDEINRLREELDMDTPELVHKLRSALEEEQKKKNPLSGRCSWCHQLVLLPEVPNI